MPASLGLLLPEFPPERRGLALGLWAAWVGHARRPASFKLMGCVLYVKAELSARASFSPMGGALDPKRVSSANQRSGCDQVEHGPWPENATSRVDAAGPSPVTNPMFTRFERYINPTAVPDEKQGQARSRRKLSQERQRRSLLASVSSILFGTNFGHR